MFIVETISRECCQPQDLEAHPQAKIVGTMPLHKLCKYCKREFVLMWTGNSWRYDQLDRVKWGDLNRTEEYYAGLEPKPLGEDVFKWKDYTFTFSTSTNTIPTKAPNYYYSWIGFDNSPLYTHMKEKSKEDAKQQALENAKQESKKKFMDQLKGWTIDSEF